MDSSQSLAARPGRRSWGLLATGLTAGLALATVLGGQTPAHASGDAHAVDQVVLNPGGGALTDGSDGLRLVLNQGPDDEATNVEGSDQLYFGSTHQYCCGGAGPVLTIGGTAYGEAGAAAYSDFDSFTSLAVVATSGAVSRGGTYGSQTGNGSAHLRYTVDHGGLTYTLDRTVTYTYPNDYYTDTYSVTIPAGNTAPVVLYNGGDTAPGSDDVGYGFMVTEPVRSVISLNPDSGILIGHREVPGSTPFDGAISQRYSAPYDEVAAGTDIGYVLETAEHDAGLMVQWDLGTTPGTQTRSLETFVNEQSTRLTAAYRSATGSAGSPTLLDLNVVNTELATVSPVGYTFTLPAGLVVAPGTPTSSCGGTLTAAPGSSTITLADGSVDGPGSCLSSVPVVAASGGTYLLGPSAVSGLTGLVNGVGSSSLDVSGPVAPVAPAAPGSVVATGSSSSVVVTWAPPATGGPVDHYVVTAQPGGATCETTTTTCVLGGVAGTAYTVTVVAVGPTGLRGPGASGSSVAVQAPDVPATPPNTPFLLTTDRGTVSRVTPGQSLTVIGDGFLPLSTVTITIYSTPMVLATVTTDATGSFSQPVTIPSLQAGQHTLVAYGTDTTGNPRSLAMAITVTADVPAVPGTSSVRSDTSTGGALAFTGLDIPVGLLTGVALGLAAVGGLLVVAGRRRGADVAAPDAVERELVGEPV